MAELSPQSTVDVQAAAARIKLSRTQLAIRKIQFGPHREWLSELEGVERPGTAHQLLEFLLSAGESAPYQGEVITEKLCDLAITQARLTDSGKDFLPNSATASRALIKPLLVFLREQATQESELLQMALSGKIPLLTPEPINRQPEFSAPAAAAAASTKKPAEEQVQTLVSELGGYNYLDSSPNTRLSNKSIILFLDHTSTSISLPRWADLKKGGRAGDLQPLQEEHCNQFVANARMLLLKYHKATPPDLDHSAVDLKSETFTVEITDQDGNTTSEERPVFHSVSAHVKLVDLMTYPYGAVTDDAKREQFCISLWGEVLNACAHIGRRTLTAVLTDVIDRSATTQMVSNELAQQATRKKASTPSSTPAKKTSAGSSSSSASKRGGAPANDSFPAGQCYNWCKEGKCLYSNQSKCRYEHKDEHKAKFPDAHMPQRSRTS